MDLVDYVEVLQGHRHCALTLLSGLSGKDECPSDITSATQCCFRRLSEYDNADIVFTLSEADLEYTHAKDTALPIPITYQQAAFWFNFRWCMSRSRARLITNLGAFHLSILPIVSLATWLNIQSTRLFFRPPDFEDSTSTYPMIVHYVQCTWSMLPLNAVRPSSIKSQFEHGETLSWPLSVLLSLSWQVDISPTHDPDLISDLTLQILKSHAVKTRKLEEKSFSVRSHNMQYPRIDGVMARYSSLILTSLTPVICQVIPRLKVVISRLTKTGTTMSG